MIHKKSLEAALTTPSDRLLNDLSSLEGDIILLGVGGKMGPSLALLARTALDKLGKTNRVIGVSRFSHKELQTELVSGGIETIAADLLDDEQLQKLPDIPNVLYMAGTTFGTYGNESFSWAMNAYLPGRIAEKYRNSKIIVFSTGNVYPPTRVDGGGADEGTDTGPIGEYAQSCLGRERIFEYFSKQYQIPMLIYRLNYAIDLRYGVLLDIAKTVLEERPVNLNMGYANVIWQGDANEIALRSLLHCETPPKVLNVTGPEMVSIQWLAMEFGKRLNKTVLFEGEAQSTALLNNAAECHRLFGYPSVSLKQLIDWTCEWILAGNEDYGKPTHFQERTGNF